MGKSERCLNAAFSNFKIPWLLIVVASFFITTRPNISPAESISPETIRLLQDVVGNRVEAAVVLGGQQAISGGAYVFEGTGGDVDIFKLGGRGDFSDPHPLGSTNIGWNWMLEGSFSYLTSENIFEVAPVTGDTMRFDTLSLSGGGGARFYFTDPLSLGTTVSLLYGRVENEFDAKSPTGLMVKNLATGRLVDWTIQTLSAVPTVDLRYRHFLGETLFEFTSTYSFFWTEKISGDTDLIDVDGDSHTWTNKLDVDVPLPLHLFNRQLRTGGFFSRTELFGSVSDGLNADYLYTVNGRLVMDLLGELWKVRWLGLGGSYFWSDNFDGWAIGGDVSFKF